MVIKSVVQLSVHCVCAHVANEINGVDTSGLVHVISLAVAAEITYTCTYVTIYFI